MTYSVAKVNNEYEMLVLSYDSSNSTDSDIAKGGLWVWKGPIRLVTHVA